MNKDNLLKLATYLLSGNLKAKFNMAVFTDTEHHSWDTECGTIGCAAGHGPYAGIPKNSYEDWANYCLRVFDLHEIEWTWGFGGPWHTVDNTPEGAGKRILYLLRKGLPENWSEQQNGVASRCYLNETL